MYTFSHIDECFEKFINIIRDIFEFCCPLIRCTDKQHGRNWITQEIVAAKRSLNNLHWLHCNLRSQSTYDLYKQAKVSYNSLIRNTKFQFHSEIIEKSDNKNKTVWGMVNAMTGRKNNDQGSITLTIDNVSYEEPQVLANIFAKHFTTIAETTVNRFYKGLLSSSCTTSSMLDTTFFFHPVLQHEVFDVIRSLKNKKCSGVDFISARILKSINGEICEHFAHIINLSVSTGVFPNLLKKAIVIPVYKKDCIDDISNYRPISILSVFSKVMEKIVLSKMMKYLDKFKILDTAQHGFRSGRSTQSGAIQFVEFVYECLDNGSCVAGLFFDLSRAFDSLAYQFILDKLYNLGFRGVILNWIRSYLEDRVASVKVENSFSEEHDLKLGVPQGSVLGPLLFLLFINDLPINLRKIFIKYLNCNNLLYKILRFILFADDSSVGITAETLEELQRLCELLAQSFIEWCQLNRIMVNIDKTICVHFTLSDDDQNTLIIRHLDTVIPCRSSTKFLGIHIDRHLKWDTHIDAVCKKLNCSYYALSRIKNSLPLRSLINVYYSLVYSHLAYNILLWGNSSDIGRVFIIQKRIIRLMFDCGPRSSCRSVFLENGILTVASIFILRCLVYVKENESDFVKLSSFHSHNTRNKETLNFPVHRTSKFESSPKYQSIKLFNHLPIYIQSLSISRFKKVVKELLLKKCFYTVKEYFSDKIENC